jgi:hypothetical protein
MSNKKYSERKILTQVQRLHQNFPMGEIIDSEAPDFLINSNRKNIGIEITRYYRKQKDRDVNDLEIEAIQRRILNLAQKIFYSNHSIPLQLSPLWKFQNKLTHDEIDVLAKALVELIEENIPDEIHKAIFIENFDLWNTPLSDYCYYISVMKLKDKPLWASHSTGFTYVSQKEIDDRIQLKTKKIQEYLLKCDDIWLIIVCEGQNISSMVDLQDINTWEFESPFDKILLYDRDKKRVYCLKNYKFL